ncbi:hypothetical protein GCM10022630_02910 [Thermobifida alba]
MLLQGVASAGGAAPVRATPCGAARRRRSRVGAVCGHDDADCGDAAAITDGTPPKDTDKERIGGHTSTETPT